MCGRYVQYSPLDAVLALFDFEVEGSWGDKVQLPRYNIAPTQSVWAVRAAGSGRGPSWRYLRWGLVPSWRREIGEGPLCLNARAETVAEKPSFRAAFSRRRCLIPADGFYEWRTQGKRKLPFYLRPDPPRPFLFAGLWERWEGEAGIVESCAVVTTEARDGVREIHTRMPVLVPSGLARPWLEGPGGGGAVLGELLAADAHRMLVPVPVSRRVNTVAHDDPMLIDPGLADHEEGETEAASQTSKTQLTLF